MANLSRWALPVTTAFVLLIFLRLTVNNWSPHVCKTILTESMFSDATCQEDLQHINEIENTNVEATSSSQLTEILYKSVTRPVQGKIHGKIKLLKYGIRN